ncbi:hypothetical protein B481_2911 [Planococcus halocryophilus Or1]|nr:hypothetical protein B481_2911 [Planococcus halocryophilus Or1]
MEMSNWKGAAGVCVNQENEVLLVLQGVPGEEKSGQYRQVELKKERRLNSVVFENFSKKLD